MIARWFGNRDDPPSSIFDPQQALPFSLAMAHTQGKNILVLLVLMMAAPAQAQQATGPGARSGEAGVGFGRTLALAGDEAFVGEPSNVLGPGAVYVFAREPSTGAWTERQRLTASEATFADGFGQSIAVEGEVLLVGADAQDDARGAVYVFRKAPATGRWVEEARLTAEDAASGHRLGNAVALRGDVALVGASASNSNTGAAYVFRYEAATGAWQQEARLIGSDSTLAADGRFQELEPAGGAVYAAATGVAPQI